MTPQVDSYRFLDTLSRRMVKSWIGLDKPQDIPWTPLRKPLEDCTVALISTAGIALKTDRPFDQEGERRNPWWGDPSYRVIPREATERDVRVYHLHINPSFAEQDLNCVLPLGRLSELEADSEIGHVADSHYSFMGFILRPQVLLEETTPAIIRGLQTEQVDVAILVPV
ncbi:MAG TPA: glycine/sarcosine/betaine reductase selenoprotein B family protein [Aggregatilineaceae bacterium]|nr:glycine/sarcosine/betaine reductase selenoprotein B family protein [Aggregatilineaceae bacterium]